MSGELKVVIGADVSQGIAGINQFSNALVKVKPGANQAAQALTNLGRVAQDAPFGFISIANNLNPLLESFQRLKVETGSTKAALSSLGSSLLGAGGLGFALSALTAVLSFAQIGFSSWTRGLDDNKSKTEEAAKATEKLVTQHERFLSKLRETVEAAAAEAAKVSILFTALSDSNIGLEKRKNLLEQLASISPKYLGHLDAEKASYEQIAASVREYLNNLAKTAELKALLPEFEKIIQKVVAAQVELNQLNRTGGFANIFGEDKEFVESERKRLTNIINGGVKEIEVAKKALANIAGSGFSLMEILFGKDVDSKTQKDTETPLQKEIKRLKSDIAVLEDLKKSVGLLRREEFQLADLKVELTAALNLEKPSLSAEQLQRKVDRIIADAAVEATVPVVFNTERSIDTSKIKPAPVTVDIQINSASIDIAAVEAAKKLEGLKEFVKQINSSIQSSFSTLAEGLGTALGEALAGNDMGSVLSNFAGVFADIMVQLGKTAIGVGVAMLGIKEALKSLNPAVAIAAGVALVGLGSALKASLNKIPKFAQGGIVSKPTLGIFGEAGPEAVVPLNKIQDMVGGGGVLIGTLTADGDKLVALVQKITRKNNFTY